MNTIFGLGLVCFIACVGMASCGIVNLGSSSNLAYGGSYGYAPLGGYGLATGSPAGMGGGIFGSIISLFFFLIIMQTLFKGTGGLFN